MLRSDALRSHAFSFADNRAPASAYTLVPVAAPRALPPPHLTLHRHALESVFAFLSFDELRAAVCVSQPWIVAVRDMAAVKAGKELHALSAAQLPSSCQSRSPLVRHVSAVSIPSPVLLQCAVRLPSICKLTIGSGMLDECNLSDSEVKQLRAMKCLTDVRCRFDADTMVQLLLRPHDLRWTSLRGEISEVLLPLLPHLLELSTLHFHRFDGLSNLNFLAGLSQLRSLHFHISVRRRMENRLVDMLPVLPLVETLTLRGYEASTAEMEMLLQKLPLLRSLTLGRCYGLEDASFLNSVRTLRCLALVHCAFLTPLSLESFRSLTLLTLLQLRVSGDGLGEAAKFLLSPPSAILPCLQIFDYAVALRKLKQLGESASDEEL